MKDSGVGIKLWLIALFCLAPEMAGRAQENPIAIMFSEDHATDHI